MSEPTREGPEEVAPTPDRLARREQLLDAADRIVRRHGPATSMSTIAAEAGVTKPILYRHFADKDALYRALAERYTERLLTQLRQALLSVHGRRARVEAAVDAHLTLVEAEPEVYHFLLRRAVVAEPGAPREAAMFLGRLGDELAAGIAAELRLPPEQESVAKTWAYGMVGMVQAAGDRWLDRRDVTRPVLVTQLADLLWGRFADTDGTTDVGAR